MASIRMKRINRKGQRAQGLVEFALAFPVFLLIVLGIFEFGRLMFTYATVFTASREAARYGATVTNAEDCAGMEAAARNISVLADVSNIMIYYDKGGTDLRSIARETDPAGSLSSLRECGTGTDEIVLGDRIIVLVTTPYMPVVGPMVGIKNAFTISSLVSRTLVKEVKWQNP